MKIRVVSWKEADEDLVQMIVDDALTEYQATAMARCRCLCTDCEPNARADIELGARRAVMILKGAFQAVEEDKRKGVSNEMEN